MLLFKVSFYILLYTFIVLAKENWVRPGCHKVGNTRKIAIPECVEFHITTNACRGFCESYALPSAAWSRSAIGGFFKSIKPVVSVGQCCNMMESEEIQKRVLCMNGMRNFTFKSAISCSCYHCKKD